MPYLSVNGVKYYYEDEGKGNDVLVFGHSMLFNLRMFDQQIAVFKENYRCLRFDFRGHGQTESPVAGYDLDTLTEDTAGLIKKLDCVPCHFVGFSMGGMVALRLAIKYPEIIKSLVLIDTSSEPEPPPNKLRNNLMLSVAKYIGLQPLAGKVMRMFFGKDFLKDSERRAKRLEYRNHFISNRRKGLVKAVQGVIFREGITSKIKAIQHDTTIMVGENDVLTDLSRAEILRKHISQAKLRVVPRAGHMSPVEEPDTVNALIEEHLKNISI